MGKNNQGSPTGLYSRASGIQHFFNDIRYLITHSKIYNYADDNTVSYWHREVNILKKNLGKDGLTLIDLVVSSN